MVKLLLIVGGGDVNENRLLTYTREAAFVVAADSGADQLIKIGFMPNVLIGDLDSLSESTLEACLNDTGCEIIKYNPDKDKTDGELVLDYAGGYLNEKTVVFCGALGNRLDHTVANIFCGAKLVEKGVNLTLEGDSQEVRYVFGELKISDWPIGTTVSLIPFSDSCHIKEINGFKYPLENKHLIKSSSLAVSNLTINNDIEVKLHDGIALVIRQFERS